MPNVIDTSAIMAILLAESGQNAASQMIPDGILSAINFTEVLTKCLEKSVPPAVARSLIRDGGIAIVAFGPEHGELAARLFEKTKKGVLSLGDRACIATAISLGATVVTADRVWATLDLPCPVKLIR